MNKCPKCLETLIHGPTYCDRTYCAKSPVVGEHLHYRCKRCWYEVAKRCADSPQPTKDP